VCAKGVETEIRERVLRVGIPKLISDWRGSFFDFLLVRRIIERKVILALCYRHAYHERENDEQDHSVILYIFIMQLGICNLLFGKVTWHLMLKKNWSRYYIEKKKILHTLLVEQE